MSRQHVALIASFCAGVLLTLLTVEAGLLTKSIPALLPQESGTVDPDRVHVDSLVAEARRIVSLQRDITNIQEARRQFEALIAGSHGSDPSAWPPSIAVAADSSQYVAHRNALIAAHNRSVRRFNERSSRFNWDLAQDRFFIPPRSFEEIAIRG